MLTTIREAELVLEYSRNAATYNHKCFIVVIGDRKTPDERNKKIALRAREFGTDCTYLGIDDQERWLTSFPMLTDKIPYDSDNRRNIGYLYARALGADVIVSIDDDNYCPDTDFFGLHNTIGREVTFPTAESDNGWFNPCVLLEIEPPLNIYSRGFPLSRMWSDNSRISGESTGYAVLNLGLWTEAPDVSAMTNAVTRPRTKGIRKPFQSVTHVLLRRGLWMPINSQNTAFISDALPCMYFVVMGEQLGSLMIDRYGDIWQGYFAKKVFDTLDLCTTVGLPLTRHIRNVHDIVRDLKSEFWGVLLTERLVDWLQDLQLEGNDFLDVYWDLSRKLSGAHLFQDTQLSHYMSRIASYMASWVEACERVL